MSPSDLHETSPMLTLAIPYYRRLDYLRLALESVRRQSSPDWRVIVADDGCVEVGARELVESLGDSRVSYAPSDVSLGMVNNWNRCLDLAESELVTILHADDELGEGYVETMLRAAQAHPRAAAFFCRARIVDAQGQARFSFPDYVKRFLTPTFAPHAMVEGETGVLRLIRGNFIFCPTLCYRKSALGGQRFDPAWKMVQDLEFTTRLLFDDHTLIGLPEFAYRYRRHGENASETYTRSLLRFEEEIALMRLLASRSEDVGWRRAARAARQANIIKLHLLYRSLLDACCLRMSEARRQWGLLRTLLTQS